MQALGNVTDTARHVGVPPCSQWERSQSGLFQAVNVLLLGAFLIPRWSHLRWTSLLRRILIGLGCLGLLLWSLANVCSADVIGWNVLLACTASGQIAYCTRQLFPPSHMGQSLLLLHFYRKVFLPLHDPRRVFAQLTHGAAIHSLPTGAHYFQLVPPAKDTKNAVHKTLSVLLTGKLKVTFGSRLLHLIQPFHFIDSPEWFMQSTFPNLCRTSLLQVSMTAVEPCSVLLLNGDHLRQVLDNNADLAFLLDCLIGKDVSQKLYAVTEEAALLSEQQGGRPASVTADGFTSSTLGPWQTELLRSQSADAVHTCNQGQMRSNHWRRNRMRRVWCRRYEMLMPSHRFPIMNATSKCDYNPATLATEKDTSYPGHQSSFRRAQHQWNRVRQIETFV